MAHSISRRQFLQGSGAAALSVAAAGLLSSCGGSSASNGGSTGAAGSSSTYTVLYSRQPATLNYLVCSADPDLYHGTQCIDTLVEYDNRGKIREGLATAWEWDADSLTWTFHLRDENWVDCSGEVLGPVTAQDFVDALAYVLNPDYASSTASLVTPYVAGANDYYNYCVYRNNANNGTVAEDGTTYAIDANGTVTAAAADGTTTEYPAVDFSTVGVKAVDDHTLTYTLNFDFPGFLSLLSYAPYEPAYGPLLEEFADQFCTSAETADLVMQYMSMVENAKTITEDLDARYEAFADAEAFLIENALVIPLGMPVPPYIATRLNLWEGQYAPTGLSTNRLKGVHILDHYVSMEEYNQNRDAR